MINENIIKKLKPRIHRVEGQIKGITRMIEKKEYCIDIFQQLLAVQGAIKSIESIILENHMNSCIKEAMQSKNKKVIKIKTRELLKIYKKLVQSRLDSDHTYMEKRIVNYPALTDWVSEI